jgi:putative transposase
MGVQIHVVFIPKYRRKVLYGELRQHLGDVFRKLALQKESQIEEGHLMADHVHMMVSIPPKYAGDTGETRSSGEPTAGLSRAILIKRSASGVTTRLGSWNRFCHCELILRVTE